MHDDYKDKVMLEETKLNIVTKAATPTGSTISAEFKFWFGTTIAYILLILYVWALLVMMAYPELVDDKTSKVSGIETVTVLVGGLISALIVSISAVTPTNTNMFDKDNRVQSIAISLYAVVWILTGLSALIFSTILQNLDSYLTTISDIGTTWLATAVATGYAYFNLGKPNDG